jgi:hypothetical protein
MLFFNLLYFICISLSFSYMWSFSDIFRPSRNFISKIPYIKKIFLCPECCSFWIGLLTSFLYNPISINYNLFLSNIICGLVTHLFASFLYKKMNKNENSKLNFIN